ncbi:hypothetical protein L7F22_017737 [Adiantum nelumboides]|nr:hypothetical protein [Adiantum nelumboides]
MSSHTPPPNRSRSFITPLFYHMPFLLDQVHNEGYGDVSYQRTGSPIVIISAGQFEREQGNKLVDIDAILEACKKEVYVPSHGSQHVECPICLEKFETNDKMLRLPCNHPFHVDCILPWLRSNNDKCPFCRAQITTKKNPSNTLNNVTTRSRTSPNYSTRDMHANYGHMPLHISTFNERNLLRGVMNGSNQTYAPPPDSASINVPSNPPALSSTIPNRHRHVPTPVNYGESVREIPISSPTGSSQETLISNQ